KVIVQFPAEISLELGHDLQRRHQRVFGIAITVHKHLAGVAAIEYEGIAVDVMRDQDVVCGRDYFDFADRGSVNNKRIAVDADSFGGYKFPGSGERML